MREDVRRPLQSSQIRMEFAGFLVEYFRFAKPISRSGATGYRCRSPAISCEAVYCTPCTEYS